MTLYRTEGVKVTPLTTMIQQQQQQKPLHLQNFLDRIILEETMITSIRRELLFTIAVVIGIITLSIESSTISSDMLHIKDLIETHILTSPSSSSLVDVNDWMREVYLPNIQSSIFNPIVRRESAEKQEPHEGLWSSSSASSPSDQQQQQQQHDDVHSVDDLSSSSSSSAILESIYRHHHHHSHSSNPVVIMWPLLMITRRRLDTCNKHDTDDIIIPSHHHH
ncbi:hypothetical protein FOZ63_010078, partial [Perkinsus olseni]